MCLCRSLGPIWPQYKVEHLFYFSEHSLRIIEKNLQVESLTLTHLRKTLPLGYFLTIGSHFCPLGTQKLSRHVRKIVPSFFLKILSVCVWENGIGVFKSKSHLRCLIMNLTLKRRVGYYIRGGTYFSDKVFSCSSWEIFLIRITNLHKKKYLFHKTPWGNKPYHCVSSSLRPKKMVA